MKCEENRKLSTKEYWQRNIEAFGKFYDKVSEEKIIAPRPVEILYKTFIFPLEKNVSLERYRETLIIE